MQTKTSELLFVIAIILVLSCKPLNKQEKKTIYKNPVIDKTFPDPTVIKANDDYFYAYSTNACYDSSCTNIQVARSSNLYEWEILADALPIKPVWASRTQQFWAPHVIYDDQMKKYFMYYSAETDTHTGKCLAVAVAEKPEGPFTDMGEPLLCGKEFEEIDPMAFDDTLTGKKLLYWGSGFQPIKVQELAASRIEFLKGSVVDSILYPGQEKEYTILLEGSWIHFRDGFYYLFYSGDNCCGEKAKYAVMVARSKSALGPFETYKTFSRNESSVILHKSESWIAPGHNSIITDENGDDWIIYHAIDPKKPYDANSNQDRRVMLIDKLTYKNGWPEIEGSQPSHDYKPAPFLQGK